MADTHSCGPAGEDSTFFDALAAVFDAHPKLIGRYAVSCVDHETDIMKIDFKDRVEIARIEGERVISTFGNRGETELAATGLICCKWWRESNSTWTCLKRWDHAVTEPETTEPDVILKP